MLQLNPNEVIRINRLISNSLDTIIENTKYLKTKYTDNLEELQNLDIDTLEKLTIRLKNNTLFLDDIIKELTEATGESIDKLLSANYSLNYYESKLLSHYADNINSEASKSKLSIIDLCYSKDEKLDNLCQKKNFVEYANNYFNRFNPEEHGLSKEIVINELVEVYDKRGSNEAYKVMKALENNKPDNYHEYNFKPGNQMNNNSYYDFNTNTINNYQTNSEMININGYNYEIVQVLPKDCTNVERIAYNYGKANIINTMRTLPNKYLELCSKNNNTITLTCSRDAMNNNSNWSGYYKPSSLFGTNSNNITIDIHGSFTDNTFYTQDTLIHEMGHKFDDMIQSKSIIDWLFGRTSYTRANSEWDKAYKKYRNVLNSINTGGYADYPNVNEFFGDAAVAYFKNPEIERELCPEVYNLISNMLDGEYGYSYNDKIVSILSAS